jgi:hypothetical protein
MNKQVTTTRYQILPSLHGEGLYAIVDNTQPEPNEICDLCSKEVAVRIAVLLDLYGLEG